MFGFGMSPCPIDKESVQVIAAYSYLRMKREAALTVVTDKSLKMKSGDDRTPLDKERQAINASFDKKELELMRRAAGPYAKMIDK